MNDPASPVAADASEQVQTPLVAHHITVNHNDPQGYDDGLSDIVECSCGITFDEVQYGGWQEAVEHLEEQLRRRT